MGQATFLDIIKAIRRLSLKEILSSLDYYQWETGGYIILTLFVSFFSSLFSIAFLYLSLSYFWCWTLASPKLILKTEGQKYRFSLLRAIVNIERRLRESLLFEKFRRTNLYRPLGRLISILMFGTFVSILMKEFYLLYFLAGAAHFELFRAFKYYSK